MQGRGSYHEYLTSHLSHFKKVTSHLNVILVPFPKLDSHFCSEFENERRIYQTKTEEQINYEELGSPTGTTGAMTGFRGDGKIRVVKYEK